MFNQKNEKEFKECFYKCCNQLIFTALGYVDSKEQAEDIVMEAFNKLWQSSYEFDTEKKAMAFLFKVVKNDCINHNVVWKGRRRIFSLYEKEQTNDDEYVDIVQPIYDAMYCLSPVEKIIIELTFCNKLPLEISRITNIPRSTVHVLKNRAIKKIKTIVNKK